MPFCNKILAIAALSALFAAPAFADGTPGRQVNRGPAPLQAHTLTPPEPGCVLIENGTMWSCPAPQTRRTHTPAPTYHPPRQTAQTTHTVRRSAPTVTRQTYTRTRPATTSVRRSAPTTTRRVTTSSRTASASSAVTLDLASFSGGVGNGVDGGFYGGGGTIFIAGSNRFSGVLSHSASSFTFRQRRHGGGKRGGGGGCGCMGGGMGGGGMGGGD